MTSPREQTIEAGGLRVRFTFEQDRYGHEIWLRGEQGIWAPVLTSIEGSPRERWPASPPLQSLHVESREPGRTLALMVGMAGKSHWSLSIDLDTESQCATFSAACRVREVDVGACGSRYRSAHAFQIAENSQSPLLLSGKGGSALFLAQSGRIETETDQIRVVAPDTIIKAPRTICWGYRISVAI